ncbi:hypothetical protein [Nocardia sp. NBC_01327]|uniref:hypothetical protein n=1 Tax=Nocardia sp. NBC_01327 TaxID=2903593 RepID=UPI002E0E69B3|nr:hypothetical protein OG326_31200 [Nocardia sp. NBC_01327]
MSAPYERSALEHPDSLFDHIARLHRLHPDGPLPDGGDPLPDTAVAQRRSCETTTSEERSATLVAAWESYIADPEARPEPIRDVFTRPEMSIFDGEYAKEDIPLPGPDPERLRQLGIWLVRNSSDRRPVLAGLSLLSATGTSEDIPLLRTIALASCFVRGAVAALGAIAGTAPDLVWLAQHTKSTERQCVLQGLVDASDPVARHWLLRNALIFSSPARNAYALHIAEVTGLAAALTEADRDDRVRDQAIGLLLQMTSHDDYATVIDRYPDAKRALALVAAETTWMTPTSDRYADLTALVEDLRTGASACLDWADDEREAVLDRLLRVLRSPAWTRTLNVSADSDPYCSWRARWARNIVDAPYDAEGPRRFEIRISMPIPPRPGVLGGVETRILVDGRPIIAEQFRQGAARSPEWLLLRHELRATETPRVVKLASAWCAEGCCGALHVEIVQEGDEVLWRGTDQGIGPLIPEFRFPAAEYDREVARAEADHAWEWPARTLVRLLTTALREDPSILARWNCSIDWIGAHLGEYDRTTLCFIDESTDPREQFSFGLQLGPIAPADQARSIIEAFKTAHPRNLFGYLDDRRG